MAVSGVRLILNNEAYFSVVCAVLRGPLTDGNMDPLELCGVTILLILQLVCGKIMEEQTEHQARVADIHEALQQ